MMVGSLSWVAKELLSFDTYLILTHVRPDGDAIGALLALMLVLEEKGKKVEAVCEGGIPDYLLFLSGAERVLTDVSDYNGFNAVVYLDCGAPDRAGEKYLPEKFPNAQAINIDHHVQEKPFGDIYWIQIGASSTCEMLFDIFAEWRIRINSNVATCLYTGISTDTGSFQYSNTTEKVLRIAANLVASGADPHFVATQVYESKTPESFFLLAKLLNSVSYYANYKIAVARLTKSILDEVGAADHDSEGFVNMLRQVKPVRVVVLLREDEDGLIRVSLRSKGAYDVAAFAREFGGGGHVNAAACKVRGRFEDVENIILPRLIALVDNSKPMPNLKEVRNAAG